MRANGLPGTGAGVAAHCAPLLRLLLLPLLCALLFNGCAADAPYAGGATPGPATPTQAVNASPGTRAAAGSADARPSPAATATGGASRETARNTAGGALNDARPAAPAQGGGGAEASEAYVGFYEVLGARPKGFEQFANFVIRSPEGGRISGAVVPTQGKVYEFARASLAGQRLTFETRKVGGVSYSFDGRFLAAPPFAGDKKQAVAEGAVKKYSNDQLAAEAEMKFYYDEGGEDH